MLPSPTAGSAAILTLVLACASAPPPPPKKSPLLSGIVPAFQAETTSGRVLDSGELRGRPAVISVVAPGCAPCTTSLRAAQAVYGDDHDITVVGVFQGDARGALETSSDLELRFPMVADETGRIGRSFQVDGVPTTFVANAQGHIVWVGGADLTEDGLAAAVRTAR